MRIIRKPSQFQSLVRKISRPLVLVPTMGALHEGHLALVRKARKLAGRQGAVAASLFVNPTQFAPKEDFSRYPRPFRRDCSLLRKNGCDLLFAPEMGDMYYPDRSIVIMENQLSKVMCGASRPGHFDGVCLVVSKLFHIVQPDMGVFGEKDYQQLAILRRMVRDLNFPIRIVSHPTVREADGLAMSSRNNYLSEEERRQAPIIYETFCVADEKIRAGNISKNKLANWIRQKIESAPLAKVDYVEIVNPDDLQPVHELEPPLLLAAAVFFGKTRLIDNRLVK
ncbi:MAG: pantoate--beta-alanine ligase [Verrucomicrobia bacterium]|nr:pantoate--beta-alanine ligase [Verrucomicrobiota bacterium]